MKGESQCLDGVLNAYLDECLDVVKALDTFHISHVPRKENGIANRLAQQASGYKVTEGMFLVKERPSPLSVFVCSGESIGKSLVDKEWDVHEGDRSGAAEEEVVIDTERSRPNPPSDGNTGESVAKSKGEIMD
jgi:hypothetical protein